MQAASHDLNYVQCKRSCQHGAVHDIILPHMPCRCCRTASKDVTYEINKTGEPIKGKPSTMARGRGRGIYKTAQEDTSHVLVCTKTRGAFGRAMKDFNASKALLPVLKSALQLVSRLSINHC